MAIHIYRQSVQTGTEQLLNTIRGALGSNQQVLWLVSGGSNVAIECEVAAQLGSEASGFVKAALIDERFGEPGHADSNYQKLIDGGFEASGIPLTAILKEDQVIEQAAAGYVAELGGLLESSNVVIAQLGIGADGHIAGVLPHSIAVESENLIEAYDGQDFSRITLTLAALKKIDQAFVFSYGEDKAKALSNFVRTNTPLAEQPCQILKQIPSVYLYNDQVEGGDDV